LTYSGVETSLEAITSLTYIPDRKGSLQTEMLATARSFDRIPYRIDGTMASLAAELEAGRPVLVLQNLGVSWYPTWHYAVVVGIDVPSGLVLLRSGTERRRATPSKVFLRTWQRSDYWAVVMLVPGEIPANPQRDRYFSAVADVEAGGQLQAAMQAWTAALKRWPEDPLAMFGLANVAYRLGQFERSAEVYRLLLARHPDRHAARNNLAYVLAEQGKYAEALDEIRAILDNVDPQDPLRAEYEASLLDIESRTK
ncbi:MAG: PA2778 family cysteine peptidase, partial [Gammaproteobacteria bacterium]|nr:PA2778 family cysteine peptidase [Gammaproteobacteria bacterium]